MADIPCDLCGEEPNVLLQTNTLNGDTVAVGGNCLITFYLGGLIGLTDGIPKDAASQYHDGLAKLIAQLDPPTTAVAAASTRRPRGAKKPPAPPDGDDGQDAKPDADNATPEPAKTPAGGDAPPF